MKTAILWLIIYVGGLFSGFIWGPIISLSTYMFTFYTQFSWTKFLPQERWSLYAGLALLGVYLVKKGKAVPLLVEEMPQLKWLLLIVVNMLILTPFAAWPEEHNEVVVQFIKLVILYYLIVKIVRTKLYYQIFIWVQIWGNWLFGWQAYSDGDISAGRLEGTGGPGVATSNELANHMLPIIPFLGNRFFYGDKWQKGIVLIAAPFILNAIILCNSRGAFLALLTMAVVIIVLAKRGMRLRLMIGLVLGSILFLQLTHEQFWNRMDTIDEYEEDGSATGRLDMWKAAIEMVGDFPLGKGGGGWEIHTPVYIPEIVEAHGGQRRSVHNTFLLMATDWGVQGLFLLLAFLGGTLRSLHKMRRRVGTGDDTFYHTESVALEVGIIGYLVAAIFGSQLYAESLYWYCALATALSNIQQSEIVETKLIGLAQSIESQESTESVQPENK